MKGILKVLTECRFFIIMLLILVPLVAWYKNKEEQDSAERKIVRQVHECIHAQAMTKNKNSTKIGAELKNVCIVLDEESGQISYSIMPKSRSEGIRLFDSLVVEICKYHCENIILPTYTNRSEFRFRCIFRCGNLELIHKSNKYEYNGRQNESDGIEIVYNML
jgi:hypothetical protein